MITPSKLIQRFLALTIALVATVFGSNAFATSLTVDLVTCTTNGCGVDQNYGDRVVGTSDARALMELRAVIHPMWWLTTYQVVATT